MQPDYSRIPERIREALKRYLEHHVQPGDFLQAVLSNDLKESFGRADEENQRELFHIVAWLWNEAPMNAWGSPEKVLEWLECLLCEHPWHGTTPCEVERGDGYRGAEFQEALGPCGCAGGKG